MATPLTDRAHLTVAVLEEQHLDDPAELALLGRLRGCVSASPQSSALARGPHHVRPEAAPPQLPGGAREAGGDADGRAAAAGVVDGGQDGLAAGSRVLKLID